MKKFFGFCNALFASLLALVCCAIFFACGNTETPPKGDEPPVPGPSEPLKEVTLPEFLARVYNKTAPNFTSNIAKPNGERSDLIYDAASGYSLSDSKTEKVYFGGNLYVKNAGENEFTVQPSDEFFEFKRITENRLEALIEVILDKVGISGKVAIVGNTYELNILSTQTEAANVVLSALVQNIDDPVINAVTEIINALGEKDLTERQTAELIVMYGDTAICELVKKGEPFSEFEIKSFYDLVRSTVKNAYDLPAFDVFLEKYGSLTLCGLIGKGSAAELVSAWQTRTVREELFRYPYEDATLADFVAAADNMSFESFELSLKLTANGDFSLKRIETGISFAAKNYPSFADPGDGGDSVTETDTEKSFKTVVEFSSVGTSKISAPTAKAK